MSKSKSSNTTINYNIQTTASPKNNSNSKLKSIGGMINLKAIIPLLVFLPFIVYAIFVLFDLNNLTLFETRNINGVELLYFDVRTYVKNIESAGGEIKAMIKALGLDALNIPKFEEVPGITDIPMLGSIFNVLKYVGNVLIWIINTFVILPFRALVATLYFIPVAFRTILAILAIDTSSNMPLVVTFKVLDQFMDVLSHISIPEF